jgi:hypothetical protein
MSINELIATSSVHAFNSGFEAGRKLERERMLTLIADAKVAKLLTFFAQNTAETHPETIRELARIRLGEILD